MAAFATDTTWNTATDAPKVVKQHELMLHEQVMAECPTLDEGWIPEFEKRGVEGTVVVNAGGNASVGYIPDGGTRSYGGRNPKKLHYYQAILQGGIKLGVQAAEQTIGIDEGVDLVMMEYSGLVEFMGGELGKSVFAMALGTVESTVTANSSNTVNVKDPSKFEVGQLVDVYTTATSAGDFVETVTIVDVAYADDPASESTLTFEGGGTNGTAANTWTDGTYGLWLHGGGPDDGYGPITLSDVHTNASLMGLGTTDGYDWSGTEIDVSGSLTKKHLEDLFSIVQKRRKKKPSALIVDSVNEMRYARLEDDKVRYAAGGSLDSRGVGRLAFQGTPLVVDENVGSRTIEALPPKGDIKNHMSLPLGIDGQRGRTPDTVDRLHPAEGSYHYLIPLSMNRQMRVERRNGSGALINITG